MNKIRSAGFAVVLVVAMVGCRRTSGGPRETLTGSAMAPMSADLCATAPLIIAPIVVTGDLRGARADSNDMIVATGYAWRGRDHFFAIDVMAGQSLTIRLQDTGFDGGIYVFTNCGAIAASTVSGRDTSAMFPFVFTAPATSRYYIAVDSWIMNTGGPYVLTVTPGGAPVAMPMAPGMPAMPGMPTMPMMPSVPAMPTMPSPGAMMPPGMPMVPPMGGGAMALPFADSCMTAQPLTVPSMISGDLSTASDDSHENITQSGYAWNGRDHFFSLMLMAGQSITVTLNDMGHFDGGAYIFTNCGAIAATTLAGVDTSPSTPLRFTAPAAGRYILAVDAWIANTGGAYTLSITIP